MPDYSVEQRVGNPISQAAVGPAREMSIEIAPIGKVAAALLKARQVDDRNTHHPARQLLGVQVVHDAADNLYTIEFVAMNGGSQAQCRAGSRPIHHEYRCWL